MGEKDREGIHELNRGGVEEENKIDWSNSQIELGPVIFLAALASNAGA